MTGITTKKPETRTADELWRYGVVVIGRNEGERLLTCLRALFDAPVIYVDSGSTDGSVGAAQGMGIDVVELDTSVPFTAARARNAGIHRLMQIKPELRYVQFVDGDCELRPGWINVAASFLDRNPNVAAVSGRLRERNPERSVYNWLCEREWNAPIGETNQCGGIVMIRAVAFDTVSGFRTDLIAGEEPELCVRLRRAGWSIWRIDEEMALHDAGITQFRQWWLRMVRGGYAFAQGRFLHGSSSDGLWVWESRRAWIWGILLPLACAASVALLGIAGLSLLLIYPVQLVRRILLLPGTLRERIQIAFFELLGRFPEGAGQIKFLCDRIFGLRSGIIEYK